MTKTVNVNEIKTHLSRLLLGVMGGEETIASAGVAVVGLAPLVGTTQQRVPGIDAGKVVFASDFDAPLEEFDL